MNSSHDPSHDPLRPHRHDPNPEPPSDDPAFEVRSPDGQVRRLGVDDLRSLPVVEAPDCYIVSTGHGASGPFRFGGATLYELVVSFMGAGAWREVEVISADGFGNRVTREELEAPDPAGPILLAYLVDGEPMTRSQGLVRMVVPSERDDALRQVKWVGRVNVRA